MIERASGLLHVGLLICLSCFALSGFAQVYKTVDEDGNVVYTDQAPEPDAEPMKLPELSVVSTVERPSVEQQDDTEEGVEEVTDIRELREGHRDFRITSPTQEETIQGTANSLLVTWDAQYRLQPGMSVVVSVDGNRQPATASYSITVEQIDRGEHTVSAQLFDARNRVIAEASPVVFFMRQGTVSQPRRGPR
mgnify:FL=1